MVSRSFWSIGLAWGVYSQTRRPDTNEYDVSVQVLYGDAAGIAVSACGKSRRLGERFPQNQENCIE